MADPPTQRSKRTRHRHRQHHSMSTGSRRNATLRYRSSTAPNRCYQRLRQHTRMCSHQTDVPLGARPEPTGNTPSHGLKSGRRNYKRIISQPYWSYCHLRERKIRYETTPAAIITPQAIKYPYFQSSSGINLKFMPHTPTKKVSGIKIVDTTVSRFMM